jgi:secreted trypsin-like serine protease
MKMKNLFRYGLLSGLILVLAACTNKVPQTLEEQIVGGREATPHQFKFMVHLGYSATSSWCGASVIDANWVLTAAHCVIGETPSDVVVVAGDHRVSVTGEGEQVRRGVQIILHPNYNNSTLNNDIALIRLNRPLVFNNNVAPIGVGNLPATTTPLRVIGWGDLSEGGSSPDALYMVGVPMVSAADCRAAYPGGITSNMFCAGPKAGGKDSCQGDSGGPISNRVDGVWQQVGIVSWGDGCARPNAYGVYTKLQNYTTWINNNIGE